MEFLIISIICVIEIRILRYSLKGVYLTHNEDPHKCWSSMEEYYSIYTLMYCVMNVILSYDSEATSHKYIRIESPYHSLFHTRLYTACAPVPHWLNVYCVLVECFMASTTISL